MKKIFSILTLTLILVFMVSAAAFGGVVIKGGIDAFGWVTTQILGFNFSNDTEMGFSIGGEYLIEDSGDMTIGCGFEYQFARKNEGAEDSFRNIPIYGLINYYYSGNEYWTGRIGYNKFYVIDEGEDDDYEDVKGGLYFALGLGIHLQENVVMETMYSLHNAELEGLAFDYSKLSLTLGILL